MGGRLADETGRRLLRGSVDGAEGNPYIPVDIGTPGVCTIALPRNIGVCAARFNPYAGGGKPEYPEILLRADAVRRPDPAGHGALGVSSSISDPTENRL